MLWGIGAEPAFSTTWAFKGGTCLKKCYIETYRFSEDLDFTVLPGGPIAPDGLGPLLVGLLDRVGQASGIDFTERPPLLKGHVSGGYTEARIYYRGPRGTPMVASIKLDLSASERVVRPTVLRQIAHAYPDTLPEPATVRCYSFEEVFAEKIRAMGERGRPRDLYDIVNLFRRTDLRSHPKLIHDVLTDKCRAKGVDIPTIASLESSGIYAELESEWSNMLAHQLPALPALADFWKELPRLFAWLEGTYVEKELQAVATPVREEVEVGWSPAPTITTWGAAVPLETIRFAAVNRLCVELGYQGTTRVIEPYSLRRTKAGHLLLYAVRADNREPRAYRVDRIRSVRVTNRAFQPVYRVDLSAAGVLHAPPISRDPGMTPRARTRSRASHGAVYIIVCPYCQKEFRRRRAGDTRLREHKTRDGLRCPGSRGNGYVTNVRYE